MTNPTPDLAAIIAAAREFAKAERFGESCCWCPGALRCREALSGKPCPSFTALIDAASRTAEAEARVRKLTDSLRSAFDYIDDLPCDGSGCDIDAWKMTSGRHSCDCPYALAEELRAALSASPPPAQPVPVMPEAVSALLDMITNEGGAHYDCADESRCKFMRGYPSFPEGRPHSADCRVAAVERHYSPAPAQPTKGEGQMPETRRRLVKEIYWGHRRCTAENCDSSGADCPASDGVAAHLRDEYDAFVNNLSGHATRPVPPAEETK